MFRSDLWSDFPLVSFKRWIKILGHPAMVMLLLTEPHWEEELATVWKRCAYVVFPISICWMKYSPHWDGAITNTAQ